jgi:cellulose synthase/poly-beta-1,6-N-acetylglucosamine synthase-like glycosyltransferase
LADHISETAPATALPHVAVVAIGRNEGEALRACLDSVLAMDYPRELLDVIYVDSASTDGSVAMAQALGVRTISLAGPTTAARGRNAGWETTSAPFVLFLDSDTVLHPQFVRKAIRYLDDPALAGVFGNRRESRCGDSLYNAVFDLDWLSTEGPVRYFGGDALVRTEALRRVHGYDATLIAGEEPDMCRRMRALGYSILHIDAPMTMHDLAMHRFRQYWRRSVRTGHAYAEVSGRYADTPDPLWKAESQRNLQRGLLWAGVPVLLILLALVLHAWWPLVLLLFLFIALPGRTAWRVRSRAPGWRLPLAYGVHSHLQHVPILLGQLGYWLRNKDRAARGLIEYKEKR